jgi:hypothetical protein
VPFVAWITIGLGIWTLCGLLTVAVACAARRGDRLSSDALLGMDPNVEVAPPRRIAVDVTPVARPWAAAATAPSSVLVEAGGPS